MRVHVCVCVHAWANPGYSGGVKIKGGSGGEGLTLALYL